MNPLLRVTNLRSEIATDATPAYVVRGVDLTVYPGETVGIVGESGSGKSLTIRSLLGLLPPGGRVTAGSLSWNGEPETDLAVWGEAGFRTLRGRKIATVFQDPMTALNPVLTVGRHLEQVLARHQGLGRQESRQPGRALLDRVGLPQTDRVWKSYPHELSGGMRQRVAIALALGCRPALLVADEPTTALDVTIQAQILDLIASLGREDGMAVLLITHDLGIVAERCQRALVMYGGRVVEQGPVEALFRAPGHPYTRALLGALPTLDEDRSRRLEAIAGRPPSPRDEEVGCPFAPRCPLVQAGCRVGLPALVRRGGASEHRCPVTQEVVHGV